MGDCEKFTITSDCYTIRLAKPFWNSEDAKLNKDLKNFQFWTDNYTVHDRGIDSQPLVLVGVKTVHGEEVQGFPLCFPICFDCACFLSFNLLNEIMDRHEEVTISGLGDCIDAVYMIKDFSLETVPKHGMNYLVWTLTLEKKRD
jgi:hypothetical protein